MISDGSRASEVIGRVRAMVTKSPSERSRLSINDVIMEVVTLISTEMQRNGISLHTKLSSDLPLISGDRIQLQQVILNLMMNAIDAMSRTGQSQRELSVTSVMDGSDAVLVTVRDSGPGLDETALERLFEAFYTTKPHGMGMGLAITRRIVTAHAGQIWATPSTPRGAKFEFRLPIDRPE
jgi:C4-dicarboxylate-specific signal transduction histidine kinase